MGPVTDTHRLTYAENVRLALQEKKDQFGDTFSYIDNLSGKQMMVTDIIGTTEARVDAPEGGDTPDMDISHEPVWVRPRRIDWGKVITKEDMIKALTDFKSEYVQSGVNAVVRQKNIILSSAFFGTRLIGNEVPSSSAWAGRTVPVDLEAPATPSRMSVRKINNAIQKMETDDIVVEEEQLYLVMDPQENEDLYQDVQFVSKDYRDKAVIEEKRVREIFGIPIIISKRLADFDGTTSTAALYAKSGMHWGPAMPLTVNVKQNPAKQYREHPYIEMWIGATRSEDFKVVKILTKKP